MYKKVFAIMINICLILLITGCSLLSQEPIGEKSEGRFPPSDFSSLEPTEKPAPTPTPSPTVDPAMLLLDSMTIEEKLGQLLIVGYNNNEQAEEMIKDHKVGGMVLYKRNYENFEELYLLTRKLKEYNQEYSFPIWIAMDEEGGSVTRLPSGKTPIPDARKVGSFEDLKLTKATGWVIGRELAAAGVNLDFAPVVDIVSNLDNKFMLRRSFGSTPEMVSPIR